MTARPPSRGSPPVDSFLVNPLRALDGVLLHVSKNGETVGFYFGRTDREASAAFAADVIQATADGPGE